MQGRLLLFAGPIQTWWGPPYMAGAWRCNGIKILSNQLDQSLDIQLDQWTSPICSTIVLLLNVQSVGRPPRLPGLALALNRVAPSLRPLQCPGTEECEMGCTMWPILLKITILLASPRTMRWPPCTIWVLEAAVLYSSCQS